MQNDYSHVDSWSKVLEDVTTFEIMMECITVCFDGIIFAMNPIDESEFENLRISIDHVGELIQNFLKEFGD